MGGSFCPFSGIYVSYSTVLLKLTRKKGERRRKENTTKIYQNHVKQRYLTSMATSRLTETWALSWSLSI